MPRDADRVKELETSLGVRFPDKALLDRALTHSSCEAAGDADYQRLEFLGDEVVGLAVSTLLYRRFPDAEEGDLTRARAHLIDETGLAGTARSLDLGAFLLLGKGEEKTSGREKDSILADAFEALMAVVYLSLGWEAAFAVVERLFAPRFGSAPDIASFLCRIDRDHKTHLQEILQQLGRPLPTYEVVGKQGPDHEALFTVECRALGFSARGEGRNRKKAEQEAARRLLALMREKELSPEREDTR